MKLLRGLVIFVLLYFQAFISEGNHCKGVKEPEQITWKEYCETLEYRMCSETLGQPHCTCVDGFVEDSNKDCKAFEFPRCPSLVEPKNGEISGACFDAFPGFRCKFTCKRGFELRGSQFLFCQENGKWDKSIPQCIELSRCPPLESPTNGSMSWICNEAYPGDLCEMYCDRGFDHSGLEVLSCTRNSTWDGEPPTCNEKPRCPVIDSPNNGQAYEECEEAFLDLYCKFSCNRGFALNGPSSLRCTENSSWDGEPPTCNELMPCPELSEPENGYHDSFGCEDSFEGDTCFWRCNSNFQLVGKSPLYCNKHGKWDGDPPKCVEKPKCATIESLFHGDISGDCKEAYADGSCYFYCHRGFRLNGVSRLRCTSSGSWDAEPPTCEELTRCPELSKPENGFFNSYDCQNRFENDRCFFRCDDAFRLVGNKDIFCTENGTWDGAPPECIYSPKCPELDSPSNGSVGYCGNKRAGDSCDFTCNPGFKLKGRSRLQCLENSSWDNEVPTCIELSKCPPLDPPVDGINFHCQDAYPGVKCDFYCARGFEITGPSSLLCTENSTWDDKPPTCEKVFKCWSLDYPDGGGMIGSCFDVYPGEHCDFQCNRGFKINGPSTLVCLRNSTWDNEPPTCEELTKCPPLEDPINGYNSGCDKSYPNEYCVFYCNQGFKVQGEKYILCTDNSTWNGDPPTCNAV